MAVPVGAGTATLAPPNKPLSRDKWASWRKGAKKPVLTGSKADAAYKAYTQQPRFTGAGKPVAAATKIMDQSQFNAWRTKMNRPPLNEAAQGVAYQEYLKRFGKTNDDYHPVNAMYQPAFEALTKMRERDKGFAADAQANLAAFRDWQAKQTATAQDTLRQQTEAVRSAQNSAIQNTLANLRQTTDGVTSSLGLAPDALKAAGVTSTLAAGDQRLAGVAAQQAADKAVDSARAERAAAQVGINSALQGNMQTQLAMIGQQRANRLDDQERQMVLDRIKAKIGYDQAQGQLELDRETAKALAGQKAFDNKLDLAKLNSQNANAAANRQVDLVKIRTTAATAAADRQQRAAAAAARNTAIARGKAKAKAAGKPEDASKYNPKIYDWALKNRNTIQTKTVVGANGKPQQVQTVLKGRDRYLAIQRQFRTLGNMYPKADVLGIRAMLEEVWGIEDTNLALRPLQTPFPDPTKADPTKIRSAYQ